MNLEIGSTTSRVQIGHRRTDSFAFVDGALGAHNSFLIEAVVIEIVWNPQLRRGTKHRVIERVVIIDLGDPQRSAATSNVLIAKNSVFHALVERQHIIKTPASIAQLRPGVEIQTLATHIDHAVDGARTAEKTTTGYGNRTLVGRRLRFRSIAPVRSRVVDELTETDRN